MITTVVGKSVEGVNMDLSGGPGTIAWDSLFLNARLNSCSSESPYFKIQLKGIPGEDFFNTTVSSSLGGYLSWINTETYQVKLAELIDKYTKDKNL